MSNLNAGQPNASYTMRRQPKNRKKFNIGSTAAEIYALVHIESVIRRKLQYVYRARVHFTGEVVNVGPVPLFSVATIVAPTGKHIDRRLIKRYKAINAQLHREVHVSYRIGK